MAKHEKPKINKLKFPLWFNIVFYILTILAPLVAVAVKGFQSHSQTFRITFGVCAGILLLWTFVKKFLIANKEKNLQDEKARLEHEYQIEVGNPVKIKYLWFTNEMWLAVINLIQIVITGVLLFVIAEGIQKQLIEIKGISLFICLCYIAAYIMKFIVIGTQRKEEFKTEEEVKQDEQSGTT